MDGLWKKHRYVNCELFGIDVYRLQVEYYRYTAELHLFRVNAVVILDNMAFASHNGECPSYTYALRKRFFYFIKEPL